MKSLSILGVIVLVGMILRCDADDVSMGWPDGLADSMRKCEKINKGIADEDARMRLKAKLPCFARQVRLRGGAVENVHEDYVHVLVDGVAANICMKSARLKEWTFWIDRADVVHSIEAEIVDMSKYSVTLKLIRMEIGAWRISGDENPDDSRLPQPLPFATMSGDDLVKFVGSRKGTLTYWQQKHLERRLSGRELTFHGAKVKCTPSCAILGSYSYTEVEFDGVPGFELEIQLRPEVSSSDDLKLAFTMLEPGERIDALSACIREQPSFDEHFLPAVLKSIARDGTTVR